jgi:hypothetical protein
MPTWAWILMSRVFDPRPLVPAALGGWSRLRSRCSSGSIWRESSRFEFLEAPDRRRVVDRVRAVGRIHVRDRRPQCIGEPGGSRSPEHRGLPRAVGGFLVHRRRVVLARSRADPQAGSWSAVGIEPGLQPVWAASFPLHHAAHGPPPPMGEEFTPPAICRNSSPVGGGGSSRSGGTEGEHRALRRVDLATIAAFRRTPRP